MPDATMEAFLDHGTVARTIDVDVDRYAADLARLAEFGVDIEEVGRLLETEGVASFVKSFEDLMAVLAEKAAALQKSRS
jgi:transaldolase